MIILLALRYWQYQCVQPYGHHKSVAALEGVVIWTKIGKDIISKIIRVKLLSNISRKFESSGVVQSVVACSFNAPRKTCF
jgi:hypothetical protein